LRIWEISPISFLKSSVEGLIVDQGLLINGIRQITPQPTSLSRIYASITLKEAFTGTEPFYNWEQTNRSKNSAGAKTGTKFDWLE
jgi:hypothetical protein